MLAQVWCVWERKCVRERDYLTHGGEGNRTAMSAAMKRTALMYSGFTREKRTEISDLRGG